jgi:DinB superfamily
VDVETSLRRHLIELLEGGHAHATLEDAIADFPRAERGRKPANLPHSAWTLVEHMRIAQWDILEFSRTRKHKSPAWPEGYWPAGDDPPSPAQWDKSLGQFRADLKVMVDLVKNPKTDLFAKIPWGDGQTILREALLVADHNAYHTAQIVDVRRLLGLWPRK